MSLAAVPTQIGMVYLLHHTLVIAVLLRCVDDALGRVDIHLSIVRHFCNSSDKIHLRNSILPVFRPNHGIIVEFNHISERITACTRQKATADS